MAGLTRDGIERVLGPVDNLFAAEIASTGADENELREAQAWVLSDDAMVNDFRPMPKGRVAELVEILHNQSGPATDDDAM